MKIVMKKYLISAVLCLFSSQGSAGMTYSPVLPQFGGSNGQALGTLQYEASLKAAVIAKVKAEAAAIQAAIDAEARSVTSAAVAAEKLANVPSSTDRLIAALGSAIQSRLANSYADMIFAPTDTATPQTIKLDDTNIVYSRTAGVLKIDITDDSGQTTSFELEIGN
tara:strand:- start:3338 stop:3835 length:498 start_codon:yes stop_codon:yes gene_type:complete